MKSKQTQITQLSKVFAPRYILNFEVDNYTVNVTIKQSYFTKKPFMVVEYVNGQLCHLDFYHIKHLKNYLQKRNFKEKNIKEKLLNDITKWYQLTR